MTEGAEGANGSESTAITGADLGGRVTFFSSQDKKEKYGTLRYYGSPEFAAGMWCGVELDRPEGKNNGSKHGIRYFTCEPGYGVFVPVERVERDTRPSRSRSSSRPSSRPNSRPSSADRGRRGQEEGFRVKPAVVQQELARLVQHVPVGDHMTTRRKMAASAVASSRQPMKAFAQTKDDTTIGSKPSTLQPVPVRGMHRAASSENLRGARMNSKPVKKSSSEQSLKGGNTLPRTAKPSKRHPRPQSVSSIDKQWPRVSTPKVDDEESGSASLDGVVSSSDSSSPDGTPSSANTGFLVSTYPLNFGLSTHASQFAEQEKHNSGEVSRVPAPNGGLGKVSDSATLSHPLSHIAGVKGDLTLQAILPLLKELMDQNQKLMQRQDQLEQKLETSRQQWREDLKREIALLQMSLREIQEPSMKR